MKPHFKEKIPQLSEYYGIARIFELPMGVLRVSWDCQDTLYWGTIGHSVSHRALPSIGVLGVSRNCRDTLYRGTIGHCHPWEYLVYPGIAGILCIGEL